MKLLQKIHDILDINENCLKKESQKFLDLCIQEFKESEAAESRAQKIFTKVEEINKEEVKKEQDEAKLVEEFLKEEKKLKERLKFLENQIKYKKNDLLIAKYENGFGFKINSTKTGKKIYTFKKLWSSDESKEFCIIVGIEHERIRIFETLPHLPNIKFIEDVLNKTNNLTGMLAYVRTLFIQLDPGM